MLGKEEKFKTKKAGSRTKKGCNMFVIYAV